MLSLHYVIVYGILTCSYYAHVTDSLYTFDRLTNMNVRGHTNNEKWHILCMSHYSSLCSIYISQTDSMMP